MGLHPDELKGKRRFRGKEGQEFEEGRKKAEYDMSP